MKIGRRIKVLFISSLALLIFVGCTAWDPTLSKEYGELSPSEENKIEVELVRKQLAAPYNEYRRFVDFDGKYYYFSTSGKGRALEYIAIEKDGDGILNFGGLDETYRVVLEYGHDQKLFLGLLSERQDKRFALEIYELTEGRQKNTKLFSHETLGQPNLVSAGNYLIMTLNMKKTTDLALLNLKDGSCKKIARYKNVMHSQGSLTGDVITGLDRPYSIANPQGFLYCVTSLDKQKIDEKAVEDNIVLYYDFESGQLTELAHLDHQPSYVGGHRSEFISMDLPVDGARPIAKLHSKYFSDYRYVKFPRDKFGEDLLGCGFLDRYRLIAYYPSSFYVIDTRDKRYERRIFHKLAGLSQGELENLPAGKQFANRSFYNGRFLFSYDLADDIVIGEVKVKDPVELGD